MTIEEALLKATADHALMIQNGQVFFNTFDESEAGAWGAMGAIIRPWYTGADLDYFKRQGRENPQGWEVHLVGACDTVWADDGEGDEINVTRETLLGKARELVGSEA